MRTGRQEETGKHGAPIGQDKHGASSDKNKHGASAGKGGRGKHRALKILLLIILLLAAAIAGTVAWSYKTAMDSLDVQFTDDALTVEFGGGYPAMDYVKSSEGNVAPGDIALDAESLGEKELTYTVSKDVFGGLLTPSKEFTLHYTVVDTVKPLILWNGSGSVLERGTEFDINKVMGYGDNADPEPQVKVDGKVDMKKDGKYPLHVTVTDSSGNSEECDLTVEVAGSVPSYSYNPSRTNFSDFVRKNAGDGRTFGIDVSTWQGDIDFRKVKEAGCDFVIIRIGYSVDGKVETDSKFDQNYKRAKEAGLRIGVYLYSYDNTEEEVRASADWIIEKLGGDKLDLPVVFDWEDFGQFQSYKMSFRELNNMYNAFDDQLARSGYEAMLYGSKNVLETVWEDTDTRPVWLAHYTDKTDYKGPRRMWQASNTGRIDGIDGDVDMDIMYEQ